MRLLQREEVPDVDIFSVTALAKLPDTDIFYCLRLPLMKKKQDEVDICYLAGKATAALVALPVYFPALTLSRR